MNIYCIDPSIRKCQGRGKSKHNIVKWRHSEKRKICAHDIEENENERQKHAKLWIFSHQCANFFCWKAENLCWKRRRTVEPTTMKISAANMTNVKWLRWWQSDDRVRSDRRFHLPCIHFIPSFLHTCTFFSSSYDWHLFIFFLLYFIAHSSFNDGMLFYCHFL